MFIATINRDINNALSGISRESSPDLAINLPGTRGQFGYEMPPKPWLSLGPQGGTVKQ